MDARRSQMRAMDGYAKYTRARATHIAPVRTAVFLLCAVACTRAFAHTGHGAGEAGGFVAGLLHPVTGLDHLVAMVAVGLWGAQLGATALWILPVTFPLVMALGGFLGVIGLPLPGVVAGVALSGVILGAMVATAARPPLWIAAVVVAAFAIFHGHTHGTSMPLAGAPILYGAGFVVATGLLHLAGIAIGALIRWQHGAAFIRVLGGAIAAVGTFFLAADIGVIAYR